MSNFFSSIEDKLKALTCALKSLPRTFRTTTALRSLRQSEEMVNNVDNENLPTLVEDEAATADKRYEERKKLVKLLRADRSNEDAWMAYVSTFSSFEGKLKALENALKSLPYSSRLTAVLQGLHRPIDPVASCKSRGHHSVCEPDVRTDTTPEFWKSWDQVFGGATRPETSDPRQNQNSADDTPACDVESVMADMGNIANKEPDQAELAYATTLAKEETAATDNIKRIRQEIAAEPKNAELRFRVAIKLVRCIRGFAGIDRDGSEFWTCIKSVESQDEALNRSLTSMNLNGLPLPKGIRTARHYREPALHELNTALAIGFTDLLIAAKARFLLIALSLEAGDLPLLSRGTHWSLKSQQEPVKQRLLPLRALADDIILDTARHLRRDPHDIQAISIQKAAYEFLGNKKGVGKSEQTLQQARSMHTAGLRTKISERARGASTGPRRKNDGLELEATAKQVLEKLGMEARTTQVTGDGGIDIEAYDTRPIFAGKFIIQCKDWEQPVGVTEVRELYGVMMDAGAIKGILISTGSFTKQAYEFAKGKPLELIDGEMLRGLISSLDTK